MSEEKKNPEAQAEQTLEQTSEQTPETQPEAPENQPAKAHGKEKNEKNEKNEKKHAARLEEKIRQMEEEAARKTETYMRVLAEYDNFRKRSQKERDSTYQDAQISTIALFLPVLDNLERAASAAEADEGVRMILKQFQDLLKKCGVEECGKEGEAFDPNFHNAVMHQEGEGTGEPVIVQVLQKGYTLNGRLIRPAMVKTTD